MSQWLREGLVNAGLDVVLLETRHVKAALSAMTVKTDRKDARGIAQLLSSLDGRSSRVRAGGRENAQARLIAVSLQLRNGHV